MLAAIEIDRRRATRRHEARIYEFGGFRLDAARRQLLTSDGDQIGLPSRAFDLLLFVVERPGELLDKSTLLKNIWPTTVVEEGNLSQCIFALRRALGDGTRGQRFIVTVPGRGYQFVAQVLKGIDCSDEKLPSKAATAASARSAERRTPWIACGVTVLAFVGVLAWWSSSHIGVSDSRTHTVVVLPFADFSSAHDMKYFTEGMAEELTSSLSRVGSLRVVDGRSASALRDTNDDARSIGAKLNVDNILEGSVRKAGERIRISARLVRTRDGLSLWSETYDLRFVDVLDIQSKIAGEVVTALTSRIAQEKDARPS